MFEENATRVLESYGKTKTLDIKLEIYLGIKRLVDILGSSIGLIVLSPVLLIVALLIKLDSKGPVFLDQKRIGKDGKLFKIYKFRTMIDNAEAILFEMMENDPAIK